jgi:hypothetical protein
MAYFWCTDHKAVEDASGCRAEVRLGPYPTREAAEHAVESLHERNERLDAEDREWEEGS